MTTVYFGNLRQETKLTDRGRRRMGNGLRNGIYLATESWGGSMVGMSVRP